MKTDLITILGPTASGKTRLAALLASKFNGEIISADSRQVYIGMNIGTGKDLTNYVIDGKKITHHLIDIISPAEEFNLFKFKELFAESFRKIKAKNKLPFLVGGTGLYISSVIQNYDLRKADTDSTRIAELETKSPDELRTLMIELIPTIHVKRDLLSKERMIKAILVAEAKEGIKDFPKFNSLVIGLKVEREQIKRRITERLKKRFDEGMIDEVNNLFNSGVSFEKLLSFGLEYKYIALYLKHEMTYDEMFEKLKTAIHQFSKRQMTWFRKMEREGIKINWLTGADFEAASCLIEELIGGKK